MLSMLRSIIKEVNGASNLEEALNVIVRRVQEVLSTEVSSIYLLDEENKRYILMASQGLNPDSIGKVSLGYSEGLVGLVGVREEPINLEHAQEHERYRYLPETGEERYESFLGVPIIHHKKVLGVLVVQEANNSRHFDEGEEAFLITVSAQLASVIAHNEATSVMSGLTSTGQSARDISFKGVAGAPGVAIGKSVVVFPLADLDAVPDRNSSDIPADIKAFESAIELVRSDIQQVGLRLSEQLRPEEQALFDVYLAMLDDNALAGEVIAQINAGKCPQSALRAVINDYARHFEMMSDAYLSERAVDIKDLGRRVLS